MPWAVVEAGQWRWVFHDGAESSRRVLLLPTMLRSLVVLTVALRSNSAETDSLGLVAGMYL